MQKVKRIRVEGAEWKGIVGKGGIFLKTFADHVIEECLPKSCDLRIEVAGVAGQTQVRDEAQGVLLWLRGRHVVDNPILDGRVVLIICWRDSKRELQPLAHLYISSRASVSEAVDLSAQSTGSPYTRIVEAVEADRSFKAKSR